MSTQFYTASSLDGFIATEDDSVEWLMQLGDPPASSWGPFIEQVGAIAMGASTYQWLLDHHPRPSTPDSPPWPNVQPTWVFTHRQFPALPDANVRFVSGDVRPVHREMVEAAGGKNVWLVGGGDLVGQFHDAGLLDELIITFAAVTLGSGKPLLPRMITSPPLRLISATQQGEAFVELRYAVPRPSAG